MPETEASLKDKLDPVLGLISRRRWYILSVAVVSALAIIAILYQLPNRYTSEATLYVMEQQVPQRYVTPTSTTELVDALPAMTQEVLSRNRLLELAAEFDLYAAQRQRMAPEEVDSLMRQYIHIEPLPPASGKRQSNAFKISFTASKAVLAQQVTSKLTALFIRENLRTREDQARNTTTFLRDRLEVARRKLNEQEDLLRDFKTKYLGELPEQQQGNLAILSGAESQLRNIAASLDRAQQQRVYIETLINGYRRLVARGSAVPTVAGPEPVRSEPVRAATPYQTAQAELAVLQQEKTKLLVSLRPLHPDVIAVDREITAKRAQVESLKAQEIAKPEPTAPQSVQNPPVRAQVNTPTTPGESEEDGSIAQLKSQLESNRVEIANLAKEEAQQKGIIAEYQSRLNLTPVREQQLSGILRDHELSKLEYADLLGKEQQSQLAMSLEKEQAGQQFRIVEPPSLPALPSFPNRLKMSLAGIGAGIFLGLAAGVLVELKNPALYSERELTLRFSVPLVVALPLLVSAKDIRRRNVQQVFEWFGGTVLVAVVLIAEAWVYRHP